MKLWDKGFSIDKKIEQFTVGNDREIDLHIAKYDVQASLAHATMLEAIGIITSEELAQLNIGLNAISTSIENGEFVIEGDEEFTELSCEIEAPAQNQQVCRKGKVLKIGIDRNDDGVVDDYIGEVLSLGN